MKLIIEQTPAGQEPEIVVRCGSMDGRMERLIRHLRLYTFSVPARREGIQSRVPLEQVYYFESVDNRTYLYTESEICECESRLYELEALLEHTAFIRISKNCICNTAAVTGVQAQLNGRLVAALENGERLVVSKHYVPAFRAKFE